MFSTQNCSLILNNITIKQFMGYWIKRLIWFEHKNCMKSLLINLRVRKHIISKWTDQTIRRWEMVYIFIDALHRFCQGFLSKECYSFEVIRINVESRLHRFLWNSQKLKRRVPIFCTEFHSKWRKMGKVRIEIILHL